ncbi:MAG: DUF106 domain-containing protein [Candidatus Heimdallarchaeota archaeon]|nr:DUF106 domain-containing protein [Candidatus Heimdallarchaeota archaeon]
MVLLETIVTGVINTSLSILQAFPPTTPPLSSIFVLIVSFFVSLGSTLISRYMIDVDKLKRLTRETKKYNKMRMEMMKTADSKLKLKYERNADRMRKVQSELSMMRMRPLLITFLPLMIFFVVFSNYYSIQVNDVQGIATVVSGNIPAIIPFNLPETILFPLGKNAWVDGWGTVFVPNYVWWYFGGSITFGSIMQKIAGLQPD